MADQYPLKPITPTAYRGNTPSAVTDQVEQYRNMLGSQAAGEDVGLFYQLNQVASELTSNAQLQGQTVDGRTPIEANSAYA